MREKELPGLEARDERIPIGGGLSLRLLRWDAADGTPPGAPFLLAHGLASNAHLWDGVARRLAAAGHLAVAVDLRGHGRSDKPDDGYDPVTIASDLGALIVALGLERPILVGQSWGASVVLETAVRQPESARGVVLVDGHLTDLRDAFPTWDECWARLAPPPSEGLPRDKIERWFRAHHPDWPDEGLAGSLADFEVRADGTVAPWLTLDRHKLILQAMWEQRISEAWQQVGLPVLILPVDEDDQIRTDSKRAGAVAAVAALEARAVPAQVVWFRGDHDIHAQRPAELAETILEACRSGLFGPAASAGAAP
jgi:pimeloyl-ACP methyl ester carboxylesterase